MKKRVLIVDNLAACIGPLKDFLERCGYEVVTASNIGDAVEIADKTPPDVAVLDLRLIDDSSDRDFSGLELARLLDPKIPKIVLTAYPSVKAVRGALGPANDGLPFAVGFLAKKEPMEMLLQRIRLALSPPNHGLLNCMEAPTMHALPEKVHDLGVDLASDRIRDFIANQKRDLSTHLERQERKAADHHVVSMVASIVGFAVMVIGILLSFWNKISASVISMAGSMVIHLVSALFSRQADKAHLRVEASLREMEELIKIASLMELCGCFENAEKRDQARQAVLDAFLESMGRHSVGSDQLKNSIAQSA